MNAGHNGFSMMLNTIIPTLKYLWAILYAVTSNGPEMFEMRKLVAWARINICNCRIKNFRSDVLIALGMCYPVHTYINWSDGLICI